MQWEVGCIFYIIYMDVFRIICFLMFMSYCKCMVCSPAVLCDASKDKYWRIESQYADGTMVDLNRVIHHFLSFPDCWPLNIATWCSQVSFGWTILYCAASICTSNRNSKHWFVLYLICSLCFAPCCISSCLHFCSAINEALLCPSTHCHRQPPALSHLVESSCNCLAFCLFAKLYTCAQVGLAPTTYRIHFRTASA